MNTKGIAKGAKALYKIGARVAKKAGKDISERNKTVKEALKRDEGKDFPRQMLDGLALTYAGATAYGLATDKARRNKKLLESVSKSQWKNKVEKDPRLKSRVQENLNKRTQKKAIATFAGKGKYQPNFSYGRPNLPSSPQAVEAYRRERNPALWAGKTANKLERYRQKIDKEINKKYETLKD